MPTPSMEDYLEQIYILIQTKGYARVSDIAEALNINPPSVSKMLQKLHDEKFLIYEKYRGINFTEKGEKVGKRLVFRHNLLEKFLELIGTDEENVYKDVEGIEHHLSWDSIDRIGDLVTYFESDPRRLKDLNKTIDESKSTDN